MVRGPITPAEMLYVQKHLVAKYRKYSNALVGGKHKTDLYELCVKEDPSEPSPEDKRRSPRGVFRETDGSKLYGLAQIQLEPSSLLDILAKKSSYPKFKQETKFETMWILVLFTSKL
ncbi:hypothetical protein L1987_51845 [Smallanthus sonchifolius]|uniref:Uncharacterized protein n=1 Tax=Smallanthus sonchifolius TaxID=185202 RepID=A0ACB9ER59_9ASTR|nr:hypothetical protein L1987_51845 [Smallanthus sonchifolius]